MSVIQQAEEYIKHQPYGAVFSFGRLVAKLSVPKDTLSHALSTLESRKRVVKLERGLWHRPKETRFGTVGPKPEVVASVLAAERHAYILPAGAAALNALGWSTQVSLGHSYISTKRIEPVVFGKHSVGFRYSRAFEDLIKKLEGINVKEKEYAATLWVALEYLGEQEAQNKAGLIRQSFEKLSVRARNKLLMTITNGKLRWAKAIIGE